MTFALIDMDTFSFRLVFDYLNKFEKVIPPKNDLPIKRYNEWLDFKKGLSK